MKLLSLIIFCFSLFAQTDINFQAMPLTEKIDYFFNELNETNVDVLDNFYAQDATFSDPLGTHQGIVDIKKYYKGLYGGVESISFEFSRYVKEGNTIVAFWNMKLKTPKLNSGEEFEMLGNSIIIFNDEGLVQTHRDYFDMGEFIYERVPVLKNIIHYIKDRLRS